MVVLGSFMIHVIADGIIYSFGLFYYEIAKHFAGGKAASSMVVSLMNGMTYFIGNCSQRSFTAQPAHSPAPLSQFRSNS